MNFQNDLLQSLIEFKDTIVSARSSYVQFSDIRGSTQGGRYLLDYLIAFTRHNEIALNFRDKYLEGDAGGWNGNGIEVSDRLDTDTKAAVLFHECCHAVISLLGTPHQGEQEDLLCYLCEAVVVDTLHLSPLIFYWLAHYYRLNGGLVTPLASRVLALCQFIFDTGAPYEFSVPQTSGMDKVRF